MGKMIIGIHGLSNKPEAKILSNDWKNALLEGLEKNAQIKKNDIPFELAYWANIMYGQPLPESDYREARPGSLKRYEEGWWDYIQEKIAELGGDALDTLKEMYGIDEAAEKALKLALKDLHEYYTNTEKKNQLRNLLKETLRTYQRDQIMLIAHSMGCIVAYDVLCELSQENPSFAIEHWITLGCPLGLPHVKRKIKEEHHAACTPNNIRQWTNLADRRDFVALDTHLRDDYQANSSGVRVSDDLVANDWNIGYFKETGVYPYHAIYGYLRTPELTDRVKSFV